MTRKPYVAAVKLPTASEPQMIAFGSRVGRAAFISAVKALEPEAEAITTELPEPTTLHDILKPQ